jgi:hypothetical protein
MVLTGTDEDRRSESAAFECRCEGGPLLTDRVRDGSLSERVAGAPAATQSFAGKVCYCPRSVRRQPLPMESIGKVLGSGAGIEEVEGDIAGKLQ